MMNFDNDLALYPDEFDAATEGLGDVIKSGLGKLKNLGLSILAQIQKFGKWLKSKIDALIAWGKRLKEEHDQAKKEIADETAQRHITEIGKNINALADKMNEMLDAIVAIKADEKAQAQNVEGSDAAARMLSGSLKGSIAECYGIMNDAIKDSARTVNMIKELPRLKMTYTGTAYAYKEMKKLSDKNSKMGSTVQRINQAKEDGTVDAKEKCLSKFVNIYQKLQACTKALLNKFVGMSDDDSDTAKKVKEVNEYNRKNPDNKKDITDEVSTAGEVERDVYARNAKSSKIVADKLDSKLIRKANGGKDVDVDAWMNYVYNKVQKDAEDNPDNVRKQKLAKLIQADKTARAKYIASVTNAGNIKKWVSGKANESVYDSSFDFDAILYDNIKESVLEDMFFEANESADAAFAGLDDSDDFDALTSF